MGMKTLKTRMRLKPKGCPTGLKGTKSPKKATKRFWHLPKVNLKVMRMLMKPIRKILRPKRRDCRQEMAKKAKMAKIAKMAKKVPLLTKVRPLFGHLNRQQGLAELEE